MSKSGSTSKARRKKKRKRKKKADEPAAPAGRSTVKKAVRSGGGGGVLQSMRQGFKRAAGAADAEPGEKPSTLSSVLWTVLLLAAVGFLIYRWYG